MYEAAVKAFFVLTWLSQFYSLIGLVVWMNRNISDPRLKLRRIQAVLSVQKMIMAAIFVFFVLDYLRNHSAGRSGAAPSLAVYLLNAALFCFIPAVFLLVLLKTKKRFLNRPK